MSETLRCGRCGAVRHVMDLVAHVIGPEQRRCRNLRHLRCRDDCAVKRFLTRTGLRPLMDYDIEQAVSRRGPWRSRR